MSEVQQFCQFNSKDGVYVRGDLLCNYLKRKASTGFSSSSSTMPESTVAESRKRARSNSSQMDTSMEFEPRKKSGKLPGSPLGVSTNVSSHSSAPQAVIHPPIHCAFSSHIALTSNQNGFAFEGAEHSNNNSRWLNFSSSLATPSSVAESRLSTSTVPMVVGDS
jgi:hypothetical protein